MRILPLNSDCNVEQTTNREEPKLWDRIHTFKVSPYADLWFDIGLPKEITDKYGYEVYFHCWQIDELFKNHID